jgi:hypothetical protein
MSKEFDVRTKKIPYNSLQELANTKKVTIAEDFINKNIS